MFERVLKALFRDARVEKAAAPVPRAPNEAPLFVPSVPPGFISVDVRTPGGEAPAGGRLLPPEVLFFHLSELPQAVALLARGGNNVTELRFADTGISCSLIRPIL